MLLCWGSFLNQLAYRLVHDNIPLNKSRSTCPHCLTNISARDLAPILSWLLLWGRCRLCKHPISILYPTIELLTVLIILPIFYYFPPQYWPAYFIFCSALIITIRTDLETFLISNLVSIYLIPLGLIFSYFNYLPITVINSFLGAILGYSLLWLTNFMFAYFTNKQGLGTGDLFLLAFIGSFTGPLGCWLSLLLGSLLGSLVGIVQIITSNNQLSGKLPFGPYLALGAITYIYWQDLILRIIL
jgi:leader peptidase (prepilin peptidase)/N-methyltransferase